MMSELFCPRCGLPLWEYKRDEIIAFYWCREMHEWLVVFDEANNKVVLSGKRQ